MVPWAVAMPVDSAAAMLVLVATVAEVVAVMPVVEAVVVATVVEVAVVVATREALVQSYCCPSGAEAHYYFRYSRRD